MSYEMTDVNETRSVRTDGDSWDITESVGSTALGVAACRAIETARDDALDPRRVRASAGRRRPARSGRGWRTGTWTGSTTTTSADGNSSPPSTTRRCAPISSTSTSRRRCGRASAQVVILAAGLDSRAYRLEWPAGTVIFEIDQPKVLEYKTLDPGGARRRAAGRLPSGRRRPARRLGRRARSTRASTASQPTAWLAEGLLPYLPSDAQDRLFDIVTELSAPGSRIAVEAFSMDLSESGRAGPDRPPRAQARMRERIGHRTSTSRR